MRRLDLSAHAQADLRAIASYTERQWGPAIREQYLASLAGRVVELCSTPGMGAPREDLKPGCRMLKVARHLVIYRVSDAAIEVLRVLHQRMDIRGKLGEHEDGGA